MNKFSTTTIIVFFWIFLFSTIANATTYYVSATGNNNKSGTSISEAWASTDMVNSKRFYPGDVVLFEGGKVFSGKLYFDSYDKGTATAPIVIGSYGKGWATISSGNSYGIYAYNTAGIKINRLKVVGSGRTVNTSSGIFFYMDLGNTRLSLVHLDSVEVYGYRQSGILFGSGNQASGYDNVRITRSKVHDNGAVGISSYAQAVLAHRNFYIGYTKVYNNPGIPEEKDMHTGSGIMLSGIDGTTIEYCEAYNNGWLNGHAGGGPVGIWGYKCNNLVIQHNESHHNKTGTTKDGGGFDLDGGCTNSIMQYNYSHDNDGAGYLLAQYSGAPVMKNLIIRYNISENDGRKNGNASILLWATSSNGGIQNADIYNNTLFLSPASNGTPTAVFVSTGNLTNVKLRNNIIQTTGGLQAVRTLANTGVRFEGNAYWASGDVLKIYWTGTTYSTLEKWREVTGQEKVNGVAKGVVVNPEFSNPGAGVTISDPTKLTSLNSYKLKSNSGVLNKGLNLAASFGTDVGKVDFWKNSIVAKETFNIGSHQVSTTATTTVTKQNQSIRFGAISSKVYGVAPFALQATATSGLAVSFRVVSGPATISGTTITLTGVGTVKVEATQSGNTTYNAAPAVSQSFAVTAATTTTPTATTRIEAEKYTSMSGVGTETTTDTDGGLNVNSLAANDWMKYTVSVSATGTYTLNFRVASSWGGSFEIRNSSGTVLKAVSVPKTGGWQTWRTISAAVPLVAGSQTIQIYVKGSGWNFNWFEIGTGTTSTTTAVTGSKSQFTEDLAASKNLEAFVVNWSVFPNPATDKIQVKIGQQITGEVAIDLMDAAGKTIEHLTLQKTSDELTQTLYLNKLTRGLYFIHLSAKGAKEVKKIIKQ